MVSKDRTVSKVSDPKGRAWMSAVAQATLAASCCLSLGSQARATQCKITGDELGWRLLLPSEPTRETSAAAADL